MTVDVDGEKTPGRKNGDATAMDAEESLAREEETVALIRGGPSSGNRARGLGFLAFMAVAAAFLFFYFPGNGGDAFLVRLDAELLSHAELNLASAGEGGRLAVVPPWPLRLYDTLRRDIVLYAALAVVAAMFWGMSAKMRARREAFLVHEKLSAEVSALRSRLDALESNRSDPGNGVRDA